MRQLMVLAGFIVLLWVLAGCQDANRGVDGIIEGNDKFPAFLVGTWRADKFGWEFVFGPDGKISSAVIDSGLIRTKPGPGVVTAPLKDGGSATYKLGEWAVQYTPEKSELSVEIVVEEFHIDKISYGLKGSSTDFFVGPVSEDENEWKAEWFTMPKNFIYSSEEPEPSELEFDPSSNPIETLIFRKQQETN